MEIRFLSDLSKIHKIFEVGEKWTKEQIDGKNKEKFEREFTEYNEILYSFS